MRADARATARTALIAGGVAIGALFAYLAVRDSHPDDVWTALSETRYAWVVPTLVLLACWFALRVARWRCLFVPDRRPGYRAVGDALAVGYLFNNLLPLRAGEAARVVSLARWSGASAAEASATVIVERAFDVVSLLLLLFVALPWLPHLTWIGAAGALAAVSVAGLAASAVALAVFGNRPPRALSRAVASVLSPERVERVERAARSFFHGTAGVRRAGIALQALVLTTASWLVLGGSFWLLMHAFNLELSPLAGLLVVVATGLAMILPSPPAAVGVFEGATVVAVTAYGVPNAEALSYALVLHAVNFFPLVLAGAAVLLVRRRHGRYESKSFRT